MRLPEMWMGWWDCAACKPRRGAWVRTKIRHMLNLGVALKAQWLLSVKDLWCKAQGYLA